MSGREPAVRQTSAPNAYAIAPPPCVFRVYVLSSFRLLKVEARIRFSRPAQRPLQLLQALIASVDGSTKRYSH
jgi:hypothetical protein